MKKPNKHIARAARKEAFLVAIYLAEQFAVNASELGQDFARLEFTDFIHRLISIMER